jgi:hypothetical protein
MERDMSHDTLTLHDIAALIVQIEPNDLDDLARVRQAFIALSESSPASVQRPIGSGQKIDR